MTSPYVDRANLLKRIFCLSEVHPRMRSSFGGNGDDHAMVGHNGEVTVPAPAELDQPDTDIFVELEDPWVTVVWNDPVNLMSYVAFVFRAYFGYTEDKANELMMTVHSEGRANVSAGRREDQERHVQAMHEYGLWATLERSGV